MKQRVNKLLTGLVGLSNLSMFSFIFLFTQDDETGGLMCCGGGAIFMIIYLALIVVIIMGQWKMFAKAGKPGWAAFIPIYNIMVLCEIIGRPPITVLFLLIPILNIYYWYLVTQEIAKSYGKESSFGWGLFFLSAIFIPILGFGSAQYVGPSYQEPQPGA